MFVFLFRRELGLGNLTVKAFFSAFCYSITETIVQSQKTASKTESKLW